MIQTTPYNMLYLYSNNLSFFCVGHTSLNKGHINFVEGDLTDYVVVKLIDYGDYLVSFD